MWQLSLTRFFIDKYEDTTDSHHSGCHPLTISFPLTTEARRVKAKDAITDSVMQRIFCYAQKIDTTGRGSNSSYAYTKFQMRTNKRNATLALVPTMYAISYGADRKFISEFYNRIEVNEKGAPVIHRLLNLSTIPHRKVR